jgi:hypothetical protein
MLWANDCLAISFDHTQAEGSQSLGFRNESLELLVPHDTVGVDVPCHEHAPTFSGILGFYEPLMWASTAKIPARGIGSAGYPGRPELQFIP